MTAALAKKAVVHVRGDHVERISPPRGLPADCSDFITEEHRLYGDSHSESWVSIEEAEGVKDWVWGNEILAILPHIRDMYPGETRLVFWFDN